MHRYAEEYNCDYCNELFMARRDRVRELERGQRKGIFCTLKCHHDSMRFTFDDVKKEFENKGYTLLSNKYNKNTDKLDYICNKHEDKGVQKISYDKLSIGRGCYYCGRERTESAKRYDFDFIKQEFASWNLQLISTEYINNSTPLLFICEKHRERGVQSQAYAKLKAFGCCKYCSYKRVASKKKYSYEDVKQLFELADLTLVSEKYDNVKAPLAYTCNKHPDEGVQYKTADTLLTGGEGCRLCHREKISLAKSLPEEEFMKRMKAVHDDNVLLVGEYQNGSSKTEFGCNTCGHIWSATAGNIIYREQGCPICAMPHGERAISNFLKSNAIPFTIQKTFDNLLGVKDGLLSYDFFLYNHNILIEYQGIQHEQFVEYFHFTQEGFLKQQEHDRRKREYAEQNNIELLEIWYFDFDKINTILESKLKTIN